jgi:transposase
VNGILVERDESAILSTYGWTASTILVPIQRAERLKLLWWDGSGLCLFAKRLEKGRFVWPRVEKGAITLTPAQLVMLIEGLDWRRAVAFKDLPTPTAV